ncbi:NAD(P)/FAD-dependent oxidoreductase [Pelagovum pacificum]|uniref:FAD-binding oxidoreductase n=1 Tax=Pelagovum pacificum TaxID=2588711 RepID=A0A5C5GBK8_9RHOB|nr:FAD-binding oxidoreductase [Pelagovum pacificum]QQA44857.1 FAD-binding oxidoreductase [Pelagovum pacificum]TNY32038.1 FAD-binding oxidoreductase [Pelagovum pacificum]
MHVVVVGAGIIGATIAWNLRARGAEVTVIAEGPGAASTATFGWVNASFYLDDDHFRLRTAGIDAWHRLEAQSGLGLVDWCGCLSWEEQGAEMAATAERLNGLAYETRALSRADWTRMEPALADLPDEALYMPQEGATEGADSAAALLANAGVPQVIGTPVRRIVEEGGRVTGVETDQGIFHADHVVLAAGSGTSALLGDFGVLLPMVPRPGLMMRTAPVERVLSHILVTPGQEIRQDAQGRIVASTVANHQEDQTERIIERPDTVARLTLQRMAPMFPTVELALERVTLANRPMPGDEKPVIGPVGPEGLTVAVMHSGVTLGAIVGELVATEITGGNVASELLAPWRADRLLS